MTTETCAKNGARLDAHDSRGVSTTTYSQGWLAAVGKSVVVTHIPGCRSRLRLPIDMGEV
jgi:hypothetical protein